MGTKWTQTRLGGSGALTRKWLLTTSKSKSRCRPRLWTPQTPGRHDTLYAKPPRSPVSQMHP